MSRPIDKHLDSEELETLLGLGSVEAKPDYRSPQELEEARRHAAICQDCARQVVMHTRAQNEMESVRVDSVSPPGSECSPATDWMGAAGGLLPAEETRRLLMHAAQCAHCGPLLREAQEALTDQASAQEEEMLSSLESARPEWRRNMAVMLQEANSPDRARRAVPAWERWFQSPPRLAFAAAACCAVVAAVWVGIRLSRPANVNELLASAFTEQRTLDIRIRGSRYAPVLQVRGSGGSPQDKPASLAEAEARIRKNHGRHANDSDSLDAEARADLLEGDEASLNSAIATLQHALESAPDSVDLLTDLGSAYFARAGLKDRAIDYGYAIESFSKALTKSPDDPIALYNRAEACRKLYLFDQAIDDWEHERRIEKDREWAGDAARLSEGARQELHRRDASLFGALLTPEGIAKEGDTSLRASLSARFEDYLRASERDWLPEAFPAGGVEGSAGARHALDVLAEIAESEHQDTWLIDFLHHSSAREFPAAAAAFASSIQHNTAGEYAIGRDEAGKAAVLFHAAKNPAGELGAKLEQVYSDQLLFDGDACMGLLRGMNEQLERSSYSWLQAQANLEESNCAEMVGDPATYRAALQQGEDAAEKHGYASLYLRGLGFQSLAATSAGNATEAFRFAVKGLDRFWSGEGDLMKGYNFYTDLDAAASLLGLTNLQVIINRQATSLIDHHPDLVLRAMAHRWYGNAAYVAGFQELARDEYLLASKLFAAAPDPLAVARDRVDADILMAQIQIRQGDLKEAASTLDQVELSLGEKPSFNPEILYDTARAELAMRTGDRGEAEAALRSAIFLSEWGRASFPSESDRRTWAEQSRGAYRNAVEWQLRSGDGRAALELWEWYRGADQRAAENASRQATTGLESSNPPDARNAPPLPTPDFVSSHLADLRDQTNIVYAVFPDGIALWVFDNSGVDAKWVPASLSNVRGLVAQLHRLCSDPGSEMATLKQTARSLYDALIAPVEGRLQAGRSIVIEPDEFLSDVPWDALVDRSGRFMLERAPIAISPGLYRAMSLRRGGKPNGRSRALVVTVPAAPAEGLEALVDADTEADFVARQFGAPVLRGSDATIEAIRGRISSADVFHFAGHAVALPGHSGLALAETDPATNRARLISAGTLTTEDLGHLELAVLSACRTAMNEDLVQSGTEDLAQSLLHANVPHVVASRWDVDSSQTAALMAQFYARLLSGRDAAESLRGAELELASRLGTAHPYYWSAFQLEGLK